MLSLLSNYTLRSRILMICAVMLFGALTVNAQETPVGSGCFRITGTSLPQTNANIDEGQLDFNNVNPNDLYKGCTVRQTAIGNRFDLQGWVWNSNLGWVSLKSQDGFNRGVSSGSQNYESYALVTRNALGKINGGELHGYWWGDNLGWLKLNCATGTNYCGTSNHKVLIGAEVAGKFPLSGYAWSDNLGWVNMQGVILDLNGAEFSYEPRVEIVSSVPKKSMYANGETSYDVRVRFFDSAGMDQTAQVRASIPDLNFCLLFKDIRKTTNTTSTVIARNYPTPNNCGGHATTNTFGANLNLDFNALNATSSEFEYNSAGKYFGLKIDKRIKSELSAQIGDLVLSKLKLNAGIVKTVDLNASLEFLEPFSFRILPFNVNSFSECTVRPNANFGLAIGVSSPFSYCGSLYFNSPITSTMRLNLPGNIGAAIELYKEGVELPVVSASELPINYPFSLATTKVGASLNGSQNFSIIPVQQEGDAPVLSEILSENFNSQGINTIISYSVPSGSGTVVRSGPNLQSVDLRIDQIASKGSIEDRAFNQIRQDSGSTSSGGASGVQVREKLLRQIYNLTAGKGNFSCSATSDISFRNLLFNLPGVQGSVQPEKCKIASGADVYYVGYAGTTRTSNTIVDVDKVDEMFQKLDGSTKPKVLILAGADLIIDQNLLVDEDLNYPVSIILLKNSSGKGGNVYFTSDVTDINAFIYADKTIYSVEDRADVGTSADERPDRDGQINDKMFSQIAFVGRFWSQNCIGCSQLDVPLKGDGSIALNRQEAQDYDLNLWRYSPLKYSFVTEGGVKKYIECDGTTVSDEVYNPESVNTDYLCWKDQVGTSPVLRSLISSIGVFETNIPQPNRRSVNIIYKAPPKTLPIFSGL